MIEFISFFTLLYISNHSAKSDSRYLTIFEDFVHFSAVAKIRVKLKIRKKKCLDFDRWTSYHRQQWWFFYAFAK